MNQLDINNINRMSPYGVRIEDGEYWFHGYEQQKLYVIRTALIMDEDTETYVAIIVQKNNPLLETILERFENQVGLFKEEKPL